VPRTIAITGTIGSGKSLVGDVLASHGYFVIDTDQIVHRLFAQDADLKQAIRTRFGDQVYNAAGDIDRGKLGCLVFADEAARKDLEAIVHPAVRKDCQRQVDALTQEQLVFVLVPLLFEAGIQDHFDSIWTVTAADEVLRTRLKRRSNLSDEEVDKRLKAQWTQAEKAAAADRVIDNSGTVSDTTQQILLLLAEEKLAI
jgi:dephospho-CoA kinase